MISEDIKNKIKPGVKVRVFSTLNNESLPRFEGIVIARKHGNEEGATFTVRGIVLGVGVEKTFPINSPAISKVEIISYPKKIRRSKLYWIRKASKAQIRKKIGIAL
jgi:large subunit ribosomal protein L19